MKRPIDKRAIGAWRRYVEFLEPSVEALAAQHNLTGLIGFDWRADQEPTAGLESLSMPSFVPGSMPKIIATDEDEGDAGAPTPTPRTEQPRKLRNPAAADLKLDPAAEWAAGADQEAEVGAGGETGWA